MATATRWLLRRRGWRRRVLASASLRRGNRRGRLKIKPKQAQIYVDGYYVGVVDSFDGAFQKLTLDGGGHKLELKADGYEPLQFDVLITPGETVTYKGELKRIQ